MYAPGEEQRREEDPDRAENKYNWDLEKLYPCSYLHVDVWG